QVQPWRWEGEPGSSQPAVRRVEGCCKRAASRCARYGRQGSKRCGSRAVMAIAPPVRWAFFPLDEQLGLRPTVGFTPQVEEGMARLGTWMPFRVAQRELAFFLGVEVAEASVRQLTEQAGAAQVQVQAEEVEARLEERPESASGPPMQLMSLDGALIQMVNGQWKEV